MDENLNRIPNDTAKWFGLELTPRIDQFVGVSQRKFIKLKGNFSRCFSCIFY